MLINYIILVAFLSTVALIWRALLLDHPNFLKFIENLPIVGGALRCGFCSALWASLFGVLVHNPLAPYFALHFVLEIWIGWFVVGAGVLLLRNTTTILMEGTGVLTHMHRSEENH